MDLGNQKSHKISQKRNKSFTDSTGTILEPWTCISSRKNIFKNSHWCLNKKSFVAVVQSLSRVWLWPHGLQDARPPCLPLSPGICSSSHPVSRWFCLSHPLLPASFFAPSGSFPVSQLFASGGQRIGTSASTSVLPMSIQGWFPLGLTGLISL